MDDLFQNPNDSMEVQPADLEQQFGQALAYSLAKKLASEFKKPWTDAQETEMQGAISTLVAATKERGLKFIRLIVTRPNGQQVTRDFDIDQINKTRSLQ